MTDSFSQKLIRFVQNHVQELPSSLLRWIDFAVGVPVIKLLAQSGARQVPQYVSSIALIIQGSVGDTLLIGSLIPDFRQRYPDAKLVAITTPGNLPAMQLLPPCDKIITWAPSQVLQTIEAMRAERFDLCIDFSPWSHLSAIIAHMADAKWCAGFETAHQYRHGAYSASVRHWSNKHEIENHRALARLADVESAARLTAAKLPLPDSVQDLTTKKYVVFHPWAAGANAKIREWPQERWVSLADIVLSRGMELVITGSLHDAGQAEILASKIGRGSAVHNVAGLLSLPQVATLLAGAASVVSVNTGIMHLAAAVDAKLIALHGPTSVMRWGPLSDNAINITPDIAGAEYLDLGFEIVFGAPDCMRAISVERVADALTASLAEAVAA